ERRGGDAGLPVHDLLSRAPTWTGLVGIPAPVALALTGSGVFLRPLRKHFILLFLRELQMFLAEEAEPRPLRAVLAAGIAAAHVALGSRSSSATRDSTVTRRAQGQRATDTVGE